MTKLVNKHVTSEYDQLIGRGTPFGNRFVIGKDGTRDEVIAKYKQELIPRILRDRKFHRQVLDLKNKTICCYCVPKKCHGEILVEYLDVASKFRVAAIGSREISKNKEELLFKVGAYIAARNWRLSSGNALGSDEYWAKGANSINPERVVLYLPWLSYNEELIVDGNWVSAEHKPEWEDIAKKHHGAWDKLKQGGKKMMLRNSGIIEKANVCLAVLNHSKPGLGGTGNAWRIADSTGIPKLDVSADLTYERVCGWLDTQYLEWIKPCTRVK